LDGLCWLSAGELAAAIQKKKVSPVEVIHAYLQRIERVNGELNAIVTVMAENALIEAKEAEKSVLRGDKAGTLQSVPVLIKDNVFTAGIRTTFGSRLYERFLPEADAIFVERLKAAGAIILGKTNLSEFGLIPITDNLVFGDTRNPWDVTKTPGGSSGGSAAAVAAGLTPLASGNDAGGSIRLPASLCGVFGMKPSFGRVPSFPRLPGWETINHEGPLTRTVSDAAMMLAVISGPDERDRFTLPLAAEDYPGLLHQGIQGLKVAYSPDLGYAQVDTEIGKITREAALSFEELGCRVEEIDAELPDLLNALQVMSTVEIVAANEERLAEWKEKIYPAFTGLFSRAEGLTGMDMARIQTRREELWQAVRKIFARYDLLLTPTAAVAAFDGGKEGPIGPRTINGRKVSRMAWMAFTYPFNFTGQPAASLPCGFTGQGMPVGLQVVGRRCDDLTVLRASAAFEQARPWHRHRPYFN
jgi:aspartyl-tRNA(Asn)/glutamyl-tRNA(Gln) amidotransferase subunit A